MSIKNNVLGKTSGIVKGMKTAFSNPAMGIGTGIANKIRNIFGATFGGIMLYFLGMGKTAAAGAMAGAAIGGTVGLVGGAWIGLGVAAVCGPFAPACAAVTVPTFALGGAAVMGTVGAIAGGLIAAGMASGSATMVSMGIGAGAGGSIGAVIGFTVGASLAAAGWTALIGLCIASAICAPFAPILIAAGPAVVWTAGAIGAAVGATIGTLIGLGVGYLLGDKVLTPVVSTVKGAANAAEGAFGAGGSILGSIGNAITGAASAAWGGITAAASGAFGLLSGGLSALVGGIGFGGTALALTAPIFPIVGGAVIIAGVGSWITGALFTSSAFFSLAAEEGLPPPPGQNQFFTITKTADKTHLDNPPPNQDLTFTISFTAKDKNLSAVNITDTLIVQGKNPGPTITTDKNGNPISPIPCPTDIPAGNNCTRSFTIVVDTRFIDSVISNTATARATPEGQPAVIDEVTAVVTVGNPPAQCPRGWPSRYYMTQGPEGATSHGPIPPALDLEAIDIGAPVGTPVFATVEGTVVNVDSSRGSLNQLIDVKPTSCAGLYNVRYQHLSAINITPGQIITFGQRIGATGDAGTGPHMHYQFNNQHDRSFKIQPPYIPQSFKRTCDSREECNVDINNAP